MKDSHYRTPRTLADCDFTVGYPIANLNRPHSVAEALLGWAVTLALIAMFVFALLGWAAE